MAIAQYAFFNLLIALNLIRHYVKHRDDQKHIFDSKKLRYINDEFFIKIIMHNST